MTDLQETSYRLKQANGALIRAWERKEPTIQMAEVLQTLHEVIAAIDSIYLHLTYDPKETA